jgi:GAF domain-containing protein
LCLMSHAGRYWGVLVLARHSLVFCRGRQMRWREFITLLGGSAAVWPVGGSKETSAARLARELKEAREQQAATADVLKVISRSTFDLPAVLDTLVKAAARLCEADMAQILRPRDAGYYVAASYGFSPEYIESHKTLTFAPGRGSVTGRVLLERKPVQIPDVLADPEYSNLEPQRLGGYRTHLGVPLLRDGSPIGVLLVSRRTVRPFDSKQIELVTTFADQAVIAIENTRLLNELRQRTSDLTEALEQQTATSEVLKVISSSPGELEPVFNAMLENAVRICGAKFGNLFIREGDAFRISSTYGAPSAYVEFLIKERLFRPDPKYGLGQLVRKKELYHLTDITTVATHGDKLREATIHLAGARTLMALPMLKNNEVIGAIVIYRQDVCPFGEKQIALVQNFAAQAVIAIENTRLLNELRQSLERQTATADVLRVISSSPGDLQPVFDAMLVSATRLCQASYGTMWLRESDGQMRVAARHGNLPEAFRDKWNVGSVFRPNPSVPTARAFETRKPVEVVDLKEDRSYSDRDPLAVAAVEVAGIRTLISVPMLKDGAVLGALNVYRREVRPFTDKQIAWCRTSPPRPS